MFRRIISTLVRDALLRPRVSQVLTRLQPRPRILMLHGVGGEDLPASVFRQQMTFLQRNFQIVPLKDIYRKDGHTAGGRPKLALTFDDGLRNNFTIAYPVLRELDAPATFFVCPGLIESRSWLWNHDCRARLRRLSEAGRQRLARELEGPGPETEDLIEHLKTLRSSDRALAVDRIRALTPGFRPTDAERNQHDLMTWAELRALDRRLIDIGAHSTWHDILTGLPPEQLESDLAGCRKWMEQQLAAPVVHFCYPNGSYNVVVRDCVGRHYDAAVTTTCGWIVKTCPPLELPRIPWASDLRSLAWRLHRPGG